MAQLTSLLNSLSPRQKISVGVAALLVIGTLYWLARWNGERDFKPLYTGLAAEDAGAVVAKLKESGVEYRVGDGGSVLVPSAKVAETRLQMAAAGLPKSGRIGYELFDKNNFGVTDFTEQINYHRALEGELERSITSLNEVERARVHITFAKESLFLEQQQPAKASVMLKLHTGSRLSTPNVMAVTHLVASAVEGLAPESVSVVDMNGVLLNRARRSSGADGLEGSDSALEYRQKLEKDLANKIALTLEPVLGAEKFRAGVSVECDFSSGEQSEESFDPERSVMVSSQKSEDVASGGAAGGVPGAASNLPRGSGRSGSNHGTTRRTESIAYQSSRTVRRVKLPQGTIKRLSISVLVDQNLRWEGAGPKAKRILEAPSPERMKVIRDLVAATAGVQPDRGDQLIVESLPFETTLAAEPPAPQQPRQVPGGPAGFTIPHFDYRDPKVLIGAGGAAVLLIAAIGFVLLLKRKSKKRAAAAATVAAQPAIEAKTDAADSLQKQLESRLAEQAVERELQAREVLASLKLPPVKTKKTEVLAKQLADEVRKDPQGMVHVLRSLLNEKSQ